MSPPLSGISGLPSDSIFLSVLLLLCLVLLLLLSSLFLLLAQSPAYLPYISFNVFLQIGFVCIALVFSSLFFWLRARR